MTAGYSGKPLIEKLGLKAGFCARIVDAPDHYWALLGPLPPFVSLVVDESAHLDFIHCFVVQRDELEAAFPALQTQLAQHGMLWVSWPKAAAKMATDLNENIVRDIGLRNGLVDVKVCAVDADWSGLKFVRRLKDRR